jgi:hypothetical protein
MSNPPRRGTTPAHHVLRICVLTTSRSRPNSRRAARTGRGVTRTGTHTMPIRSAATGRSSCAARRRSASRPGWGQSRSLTAGSAIARTASIADSACRAARSTPKQPVDHARAGRAGPRRRDLHGARRRQLRQQDDVVAGGRDAHRGPGRHLIGLLRTARRRPCCRWCRRPSSSTAYRARTCTCSTPHSRSLASRTSATVSAMLFTSQNEDRQDIRTAVRIWPTSRESCRTWKPSTRPS